jgi:hypothetical protein
MAKGWESKAVESQVQDFESGEQENPQRQLTAAQTDAHRKREVLLLSRARVAKDLESSTNPRYRDQLMQALADLDLRLSDTEEV